MSSNVLVVQVQEWKGSAGGLRPTEWGWQQCDMGSVPLQTDLAPAPENLLRVIRCNRMADTLRCTCKKHNIECSPACENFRGSGCTNKCHEAMMKMMILRTFKCNSLDCLDSNVFNDV